MSNKSTSTLQRKDPKHGVSETAEQGHKKAKPKHGEGRNLRKKAKAPKGDWREGIGICTVSKEGFLVARLQPPLPDTVLPLYAEKQANFFPGDEVKVIVSPTLKKGEIAEATPRGKSFMATLRLQKQRKGKRRLLSESQDGNATQWKGSPCFRVFRKKRSYPVIGVPEGFRDAERAFVHASITAQEEGTPVLVFEKEAPSFWSIATREEAIKLECEVPTEFSHKTLAEAATLPQDPSEEDMAGRDDLRHIPFVTIDGDDSRDFDDAVHVERKDGGYLLRVAIADVSHYVRLGSSMDKEALGRGNSWYFPASVEHMLPTPLSCGLCSLMPGKNRLVVYASILFGADGALKETAFGVGVIQSAARLCYDEVRDILLKEDKEKLRALEARSPKAREIVAMLGDALELFRILKKGALARGMLDFNIPDVKATFDGRGVISGLVRAERHEIHELIEQFMLAANEAVARKLEASGTDFLYRVHPAPTKEKLLDLKKALSFAGMDVACTKDGIPDLEKVFAQAKGTPLEFIASRLCLRSMQQACYDRAQDIHFGLGLDCYCHFTSPIRRYADLCVHRALKHVLGKDAGPFRIGPKLDHVATKINEQAKKAQECERDMRKCLGILWANEQDASRTWSATVTSVMSFGVFVELDDVPVEGLIHIADLGCRGRKEAAEHGRACECGHARSLRHEWFEFDEKKQTLSGEGKHGTVWRVGCKLDVFCVKSDVNDLQIDFVPASEPTYRGAPAQKAPREKNKGATDHGRSSKTRPQRPRF